MDKITELLIKLKLFSPMFINPALLAKAPEIIAGVGAVGKGISKMALGAKQKREAKKLNPVRPNREVQDEYNENAAMYRNMVYAKDPSALRALENINQGVATQTSQAAKYAKSGGDVLNMLSQSQQNANQAYSDLSAQESANRRANMSAYQAANEAVAREKQSNWEYNRKEKFEEDAATKAALTEASIKNKQAGATEAIGGVAKTAGSIIGGKNGGEDMASPNAKPKGKKSKIKVSKKGIQSEVGLKEAPSLNTPAMGGILGMLK